MTDKSTSSIFMTVAAYVLVSATRVGVSSNE